MSLKPENFNEFSRLKDLRNLGSLKNPLITQKLFELEINAAILFKQALRSLLI